MSVVGQGEKWDYLYREEQLTGQIEKYCKDKKKQGQERIQLTRNEFVYNFVLCCGVYKNINMV